MNAEPQRDFVDANVLVYAFDSSAGRKQQAARALLERLWESNSGCVSIQVLQEFFVTVTKKVAKPLPVEDGRVAVADLQCYSGGHADTRPPFGPFTRVWTAHERNSHG